MAISLRSMYQDTKQKYRLDLIAGEDGLDNVVNWVHFMEDITTMDFIKGSELIITTGMGNNSEEWLDELIRGLSAREECGLIINTGVYINNIPSHIIDYCNEIGFPLFTMPWEVHLVDIMQDYCNRIFMGRQNELNESAAFLNAIISPENSDMYESYLMQSGYNLDESYCVCIIKFQEGNFLEEDKNDLLKKVKIGIMNISNRLFIKYSIVEYNKDLLIVLHDITSEEIERYADRLDNFFRRNFSGNKIRIAVGSRVLNIRNLFKSFKHASFAKKMALKNNESLVFYEQMGVNKLIFDISDKGTLINFYKNALGALEDYDNKHNTDYMNTLKEYINNDCSIQAVADLTFTHRNTINYRIRKIKSIIGSEINNMNDKFNLQMAFYIKDVLDIY